MNICIAARSRNREGIEELKKLGIDTIVDLRGERHGLMEKERAHAESLGMRLVSVPGTGWTAPRDEQVAQFFALVSETPRRKIFIHCWFGGDRDGMFVAAYRIAFDGWTGEEAVPSCSAIAIAMSSLHGHPNRQTLFSSSTGSFRLWLCTAYLPIRSITHACESEPVIPF